MTDRRASITSVRRLVDGHGSNDQDLVAVERPLRIRVTQAGRPAPRDLGLLMRTPGHDDNLVTGFLHGEDIIRSADDLRAIETTVGSDDDHGMDTSIVTLGPLVDWARVPAPRPLPATAACGLCGRLSMQVVDTGRACPRRQPRFTASMIQTIPGSLRRGQDVFDETGGLHAAALFDPTGACTWLREDVGRHNAVDKAIGAALGAGLLPAHGYGLAVSGRVAYEIVQKAALAGVAAIVAVGAPSSLALDAARATHLTLIGFVRDGRFNVYTDAGRVVEDQAGRRPTGTGDTARSPC